MMNRKCPSIGELEKVLGHIRKAGGVPNWRYYAALRAARALEAELDKPNVLPEGNHYRVTAANGREWTLFVPKGQTIWEHAKAQGIEMISFSKA